MFDLQKMKLMAIEQVMWAEKELRGKTGAEKRAAVVKKLDDLIVLPPYLEWVDDIFIGKLVDMVCDKLNLFTNHNFGSAELSEKQEREIAAEIEISEEKNQ